MTFWDHLDELRAAVIPPKSDMFTLLAASLPMWMLYEASICIVRRA